MIWSQFTTKVLQINIDINEWDKIYKCKYSKENSSLEQNLYLHNQMHMVSIKIPQKGRKKNFKFFSRITKR